MAITTIHPITATVHKSIDYICNPDKTENELLIDEFACAHQTAAYEFEMINKQAAMKKRTGKNLAYHLIQSFDPEDDITPETALKIGKELADKLLKNEYSYVITTHVDKGHIHNHIIFCSTNNVTLKHYHDDLKSYHDIRTLNDNLCREHGLHYLEPTTKKAKSYVEWKADKEGSSWKQKLKKDIDEVISVSASFDDFIEKLKERSIEVENIDSGAYIKFRPAGAKHFIRGREGSGKGLGKEYTREALKERIENKVLEEKNKRQKASDYYKSLSYENRKVIDKTAGKFAESKGLQAYADRENLKIKVAAYNALKDYGISSIGELYQKLDIYKNALADNAAKQTQLSSQIKEQAEVLEWAKKYSDTKSVYTAYYKAKDRDAMLRKYEPQIIIYEAARRQLKGHGINPSRLDINRIQSDLFTMQYDKMSLVNNHKKLQREYNRLCRLNENLQSLSDAKRHDLQKEKSNKKQPSIDDIS